MDYGYLTAVKRFAGVPRLVTLYDIACQWSINLKEHIDIYRDFMCPKIPKKVYLVPKFHLPGHIKDCQEKYCMSFHIHVGENDSKAPEHSWAISNGVAASTREMGPGHQCEKLDQHFGDFNWQKNVSQGDTLLCKIKDAVLKASDHEDWFKHFTASLPQSDIAKWTQMVETWEVDRNKPNPFARTVASKTEAAMHLQLAREDVQDEIAGLNGDALHTTSPKSMISQGIQLKSSQLLKVKMDRVEHTLEHEANLWLSHAKSAAEGVALINAGEGASAYMKCQAAIQTSLQLLFKEKWRFVGQWLELGETGEALASDKDVFDN
ncbi:hypothetical protein EDD18DRAFT_1358694 [Armillaria luteobubalina]|uniref:CxC2-like cysteine cluster KDZ transposase-associated domain-containing protein n=1 Tax=Armillaria luteobubalina TaxID=153913 RepID=A0AA39TI65_9AGAR|nr:hypothetical protein EDD18DRAFT_1358694 [Armillaria luteobubalina]